MTPLAETVWTHVGDGLLMLPVGSLEQHGPHLPLDTDTRIADALAAELARRRPDTVLAPALPYGASGEHEGFPGTVSVGHRGLETHLIELVRSASRTFSRILLINWHGGNVETLERVSAAMRAERRDIRHWTGQARGDAHAGRTETSLLLALEPRLVRLDRAEAGNTAPLAQLWPDLRAGGVRAVSGNGVLGDPAGASAGEGRAAYAALVEELAAAAEGWWPYATAGDADRR